MLTLARRIRAPRTSARAGKARLPRERAGFTLLEILVALVILAVLSGVVITQVTGRLGQGEAAALAQNLSGINRALQAFRQDVGRYPAQLGYLAAPLPAGAQDACGRVIPAAGAAAWRGPYLDRVVPATGLVSGPATIRNPLRRDPPTAAGGSFATLLVEVTGVDRPVADELERSFDGDANPGGGSVRWSAGSDPEVGTLVFAVPVRGC